MNLDRPVLPLYYRVSRALERRIEAREWKVGHRVPSEDDLCREFRVSRMTVRQAVGRLVQSGLVVRRRGSGTYVAAPAARHAVRALTLTGALEDLFAQVERAQVTAVSLAESVPPPDVAEAMGMDEHGVVTVVSRVRAFEGEPVALTLNYLPVDIGRRLRTADLGTTPLLVLLERTFGLRFTHAEQSVEARVADDEVADALGIKYGDPVLYVERAMFAGAPHPVEVVRSQYRADRYRYHIRLVRGRPGPRGAARADRRR